MIAAATAICEGETTPGTQRRQHGTERLGARLSQLRHAQPYPIFERAAPQGLTLDLAETYTHRGRLLAQHTGRDLLEQRFGLVDGYSRTLEEVGRQFKVTRERIRQIEAKALRKMRHPTRIRQLEGFLDAHEM